VGDDGVRNDPSVVVVKSGDVIMLLALLLVGNPGIIKSTPNKADATDGEGMLWGERTVPEPSMSKKDFPDAMLRLSEAAS